MLAGDWLFVSARASGGEPDVERQTRRAWEAIAAETAATMAWLGEVRFKPKFRTPLERELTA